MARWLLASALEHILQGNFITTGEGERGWEERVSDIKKNRKRISEIDSIF